MVIAIHASWLSTADNSDFDDVKMLAANTKWKKKKKIILKYVLTTPLLSKLEIKKKNVEQ